MCSYPEMQDQVGLPVCSEQAQPIMRAGTMEETAFALIFLSVCCSLLQERSHPGQHSCRCSNLVDKTNILYGKLILCSYQIRHYWVECEEI
jgi:hypothetical protein